MAFDFFLFRIVGIDQKYILPKLHEDHRDGHSALEDYKRRLRESSQIFGPQTESILELMKIDQLLAKTQLQQRPCLLVLANRAYDQNPEMGAAKNLYQQRLEKIKKHFEPDVDLFVLPVAALVGLGDEEKKNFISGFLENFSAVMSVGGADIFPSLYRSGISAEKSLASPARVMNEAIDREEVFFVREWVRRQQRAFFGICRGHQMLGVALGFQLHPHIESHGDGAFEKHSVHAFDPIKQSAILEKSRSVLSFHHQAIDWQSHPGNIDLEIHEIAMDGTIEAVKSRDGLLHGFQYHPEFMDDEVGRSIFAELKKILETHHRQIKK